MKCAIISWDGSFSVTRSIAKINCHIKFGSFSCQFVDFTRTNNNESISINFHYKISHNMTKSTKLLCTQRRLRSAWASAQSDQSSLCPQWVAKGPRFLHADSEDSGHTLILLVLSCHSSNKDLHINVNDMTKVWIQNFTNVYVLLKCNSQYMRDDSKEKVYNFPTYQLWLLIWELIYLGLVTFQLSLKLCNMTSFTLNLHWLFITLLSVQTAQVNCSFKRCLGYFFTFILIFWLHLLYTSGVDSDHSAFCGIWLESTMGH